MLAPFARQHRLGMELDAVHGPRPMPQAHDEAVLIGARADLERLGQAGIGDDERVIAAGDERLRDAGENAAAVVLNRSTSCRASATARARPRRRSTAPMA